MSELPPPADGTVAIPYATREDTGLAAAYRLVGWFYLAMAVVGAVSALSAAVYAMARSGSVQWSTLGMYGATLVPRAVSLVGAVGMIRTRGWGAIALAATYALGMLLSVGSGLVQFQQTRSVPSATWVIAPGIVSGILSGAVMALFPLGLWRICRNKDVLR